MPLTLIPGLLSSRSVTDKVSVYFENKEPSIKSYQYTNAAASKLFNFSSDLDVRNYLSSRRNCQPLSDGQILIVINPMDIS